MDAGAAAPNATVAERCKDDLTCVIGGNSGPVDDGTARLRSLNGVCIMTLQWGSDTFTHKLEMGGVTDDDGKWTSDAQRVTVTFGGGVVIEDCSLP